MAATANNNDSVTWLADSGASEHYMDTNLESSVLTRASEYTALKPPFEIVTGKNNKSEAVSSVPIGGAVTDRERKAHYVALSLLSAIPPPSIYRSITLHVADPEQTDRASHMGRSEEVKK